MRPDEKATTGKRTQRNSNVEVLRMFVMFGILLWHVTVHGYGLAHMGDFNMLTVEHGMMNSLSVALFASCVDLFVLISGYYGIRFSLKTLARFEGQAIFYSYITALGAFVLMENIEILSTRFWFPIICGRWWFLTTYIMLSLIAPILNEGIRRLTERQHLTIIILFVIINCFGYLFIRREWNGQNLQSFILIYIIGQYLRAYKDKYRLLADRGKMSLALAACVAINFAAVYFCLQEGAAYPKLVHRYMMLYLSYSNPVIVLQSVLILCLALTLAPTYDKRINLTAKHVFGVYLITEGIGSRLYKALRGLFDNSFLLGMAACIVVFALCLLIEAARSRGYDFLYDRISPKAHRLFSRTVRRNA